MERKPISSIQGQVRLVVGILVLLSGTLAALVSLNWLFMTAFIGVALVVASFTGVCPMEAFVSRCPWNQSKQSSAAG